MSASVRCLYCNVWLVPFGHGDLGVAVLDHLHTVHGQEPTDTIAHLSNPDWQRTPEPVA